MVTIKNFVAKNKVGPPCKLEGYIYCIKCWLDRRAINWTPIPEKRHLSTIGNEHGFCLPCAENAAFQTKANEEKRSAKVKVAQQEAREALPDEPINYIFPAFLGMLVSSSQSSREVAAQGDVIALFLIPGRRRCVLQQHARASDSEEGHDSGSSQRLQVSAWLKLRDTDRYQS